MMSLESTRKSIWQSCVNAIGPVLIASAVGYTPAYADPHFNLGAGAQTVNTRVGTSDNILPQGFSLERVAVGTDPLENPSGKIVQFGFLSDGTRTEPDENTYLVLDHNPGGPTPGYDYGRHFLFQGHENAGNLAYVTRINLDVSDPQHRITLLTPVDPITGLTGFNSVDGSIYDPHTNTMLFTQEAGTTGGVIEIGVDWPSTPRTLYGIFGRGGYEGITPDKSGNIYIAEDSGGSTVLADPTKPQSATNPKTARNPNSFIYRFEPYDKSNLLAGGKLKALQVLIDGQPVKFIPIDATNPTGDVFSSNQAKLHTLGTSFPIKWVTVHDTVVDGTSSFDANALAKTAGATPFKRPENLKFLPGSGFKTLFFDATGDTDAIASNNPTRNAPGGWGSIFRVDLGEPQENDDELDQRDVSFQWRAGRISIFAAGDAFHASFDNLTFVDTQTLLAGEDRGDGLHGQLNMLDSIWAYNVRKPGAQPVRFLALGRDQKSIDTAEDNEPTGVLAADGDSTVNGMVGQPNNPNLRRIFFTEQHGNNQLWEVIGGGITGKAVKKK